MINPNYPALDPNYPETKVRLDELPAHFSFVVSDEQEKVLKRLRSLLIGGPHYSEASMDLTTGEVKKEKTIFKQDWGNKRLGDTFTAHYDPQEDILMLAHSLGDKSAEAMIVSRPLQDLNIDTQMVSWVASRSLRNDYDIFDERNRPLALGNLAFSQEGDQLTADTIDQAQKVTSERFNQVMNLFEHELQRRSKVQRLKQIGKGLLGSIGLGGHRF